MTILFSLAILKRLLLMEQGLSITKNIMLSIEDNSKMDYTKMKMLTLSQLNMTIQEASKREKKMGLGVSSKKNVLLKLDRKSIDLSNSIKAILLKIYMLAKRECLSIDIHFNLVVSLDIKI